MEPVYMPNHLDDQVMVLFWSADELLPLVALVSVGILVGHKLLFLALGLLAVKYYRKTKEGRPDGYLLHLMYWWGFLGKKAVRTMPNPFIREFLP